MSKKHYQNLPQNETSFLAVVQNFLHVFATEDSAAKAAEKYCCTLRNRCMLDAAAELPVYAGPDSCGLRQPDDQGLGG